MKNILFSIFLMIFIPITANSQAMWALIFGDKMNTDQIKLGLLLGGTTSYFTKAQTVAFRPNIAFAIGAYVDVKIDKRGKWHLQNYLLFKAPKGAAGLDVNYESFPVDPSILENMDMIKRSLTYIQLTPIMRYCFNPEWNIGIGPYGGLLMIARDTYSAKEDRGALTHRVRMWRNFVPIDFGLAFDVQYRLLKGEGIQINLRYEQGLINIYKKSTGMYDLNMAFQLGVGIPIKSTKAPKEGKEVKEEKMPKEPKSSKKKESS